MKKTAILVDGGFYQKRARNVFGDLTPKESQRIRKLLQKTSKHKK